MGKGAGPPDWVVPLLMAEEWGMPPWQIEERISEQWYQRWLMLAAARANAQEVANKRRDHGGGTKRVREL